MKHHQFIDAAKEAISQLHGDMSVPAATTLEALRDVRDHLDTLIDCTEVDVRKAEKE